MKEERRREAAKRPFNIPETRKFLMQQKQFLESMIEETVDVDAND